ncbi:MULTISPECIES: hypothetical protein [unclassified Massilia]|uniref:hypothetical protein n=1 Tax=unclassified Massilia TaxID=2609279 RepID=UPI00177E29EC|nr:MULTISPECIES: hypothetical protein [unclassified Massilia]MBD8531164.1 hypothetical protein [Massilia sp. CFBP 13647]MBD8675000.1 hypothetical protein [Massilia sp. CFBP 13721]
MRPTDENQAGSTRPNLMSSRRAAGEENILAMLERDSARRPGTRMSGVRLASYGAAAALVGILAGGVAWLAYDNHQTGQELIAQHELANPVPPLLADAPPPSPTVPAPAPAADAPRTAVIVDESAPARDTAVASALPPLVMLPPHELAGARPTPTPRPAPESVQPTLAKAETPPAQAKHVTAEKKVVNAEAPVAPARPATEKKVTKAAAPATAKKADKPAKSASRAAKPAKARPVATAKAKPDATRQRKAATSGETAVDSDVALISAIIQHSERHRGEREAAAACKGPHCARKPGKP